MGSGLIDFVNYLESLAAKHVDVKHDANSHPAFVRFYDGENINSAIRSRIKNVPCIIVKDYDFTLKDDRSDNLHKEREIEFLVVDKLGRNASMNDVYAVWDMTEEIGDECLVKMKADKRSMGHLPVIDFNLNGVRGVPVDLEVSGLYGTSYTLRISTSRSTSPDPNKWEE